MESGERTDSPAGIMVKSMLTGMAEYYSAELSEKVVRGMTENVLKGKYNGGTIPIGFKVDEEKFFQVDPLKAPFVVEAFQRYNDGATMKDFQTIVAMNISCFVNDYREAFGECAPLPVLY